MRNILLTLILLLSSAAQLYAEPFFLHNPRSFVSKIPLEYTIKKEPVLYIAYTRINGEETPIVQADEPTSVTEAYTSWFKNALQYINEENRHQFDFMMDILEFGASPKAIKRETTDDWAPLYVYFVDKEDKEFKNEVGSFPAGYFKARLCSFVLIRDPYHKDKTVLIHELGHALGIGDSYQGAIMSDAVPYGTSPRDSIMNPDNYNSKNLTCDDADALVNAVWLFLKEKNPNTPDLQHDSFCKAKEGENQIRLKNARQMDREPLNYYDKGFLVNTFFCKDGEIKQNIIIEPHEPNNIKIDLKNEACPTAEYDKFIGIEMPENIQNGSAKLLDLLNNKSKIQTDKNNIVYEYAPYLLREISFNTHGALVSVVSKNEKALFYIYAIIDSNYAYVYSNEKLISLVYNMKNPNLYFAKNISGVLNCTMEAAECETANKIAEKMDKDFVDSKSFRYGFSARRDYKLKMSEYIAQAVRWQNYIIKNYPHLDFKLKTMKIDSKAFKKLLEDISKNSPF